MNVFFGLVWIYPFPPPSLDLESPTFLSLAFVYVEELTEARLEQCW